MQTSSSSLIRDFFASLGRLIGRWSLFFGLTSLVVGLALSAGMVKMRLRDSIRDGYTPMDAPSRAETAAMRQFWNASGDPMRTMVLIRSKLADKNMLRLDLLSETVQLNQFLMRQFECFLPSATNDDNGGRITTFTYADLCAPYCEFNFAIELFVDGLGQAISDQQQKRVDTEAEEQRNGQLNLSFPLATVHSFQLRLEWFFSGVTLRNNQTSSIQQQKNGSVGAEKRLTNMETIQLVVLTFQADRSTALKAEQLSVWEMAVFDYLQNQFQSDILDVQVIGVEILDNEMTRDHRENIHFFALGFLAMSVFVAVNVFTTGRLQGRLDAGKPLLAAATVLCPLLAIGAAYGAMSWCGMRTNSFLLILPYLILGIGVDDGFLLMHRWFQLAPHVRRPVDRLSLVFAEVGPSITVTTLTNVISFAVGALTPTPEIRLFCFGTALALSLDYALQLLLFCPVMLWSAHFERFEEEKEEAEESGRQNGKVVMAETSWSVADEPTKARRKYSPSKMEKEEGGKVTFLAKLLNSYCGLLSNRKFALLILAALALYWGAAILGTERIETRLDIEKILPRDSKMRETTKVLNELYWANHLAVAVLVNGPLNISSNEQNAKFWAMVRDFEQALPRAKGAQSSLVWLRDYENFFWGRDDSAERLDALMGELQMDEVDKIRVQLRNASAKEDRKLAEQPQLDLCRLDQFLDSPFYTHWTAFLRIQRPSNRSCPVVSAFVLSFAFRQIHTWEQRIDLVLGWRALAAKHSRALGLPVSTWDENAKFVDQMLSLRSVTAQSGLLTLVCMCLVCALFIPNPCSVLLAAASICSISIGVFGFLAWLGFDLDPVTMAATLMSLGLSVDFTAHVIYHFRQDFRHEYRRDPTSAAGFSERLVRLESQADKLRHTLESVGWPMFQSGLSTALCILPLAFVRKYAPTVFVNAVFLVCGWGLLHGLLLIPCLLCLLPSWCSSSQGGWARLLRAIGSLCPIKRGQFRVQNGEIMAGGNGRRKKLPSVQIGPLEEEDEVENGGETVEQTKAVEQRQAQAVLMSSLLLMDKDGEAVRE